jgi:SAM-dependent methyltransferase
VTGTDSAVRAPSLALAASRLRPRLEELKAADHPGFEWYPYDSLSNAAHLLKLFGPDEGTLLDAARSRGVLDLGCADGDMSFLFESLGCPVTAVDNAATSHNEMRGVECLRERLGSRIELCDIDIDRREPFPQGPFGLALFLGTLYHLRNPFHALDVLAPLCDYCALSTRIARRLPGGTRVPEDAAIAYLLDEGELNSDDTNYWIFFEPALRRMFRRTRWECVRSFTTGATRRSDPVRADADERAYYLLRSRFFGAHLRLISGWHDTERNGSRWTSREFSVGVPAYLASRRRLCLRVFVPDVVLSRLGPVRLTATVDGVELDPMVFAKTGLHKYSRALPPAAAAGERVVRFALDKSVPAGELDQRELGIIVAALELEA